MSAEVNREHFHWLKNRLLIKPLHNKHIFTLPQPSLHLNKPLDYTALWPLWSCPQECILLLCKAAALYGLHHIGTACSEISCPVPAGCILYKTREHLPHMSPTWQSKISPIEFSHLVFLKSTCNQLVWEILYCAILSTVTMSLKVIFSEFTKMILVILFL